MTFGYENEFFVKDQATGKIITDLPHYVPQDAYGVLAEVRSEPNSDPRQTLWSYNKKLDELKIIVSQFGGVLSNIREYQLERRLETAGFHIHFSTPEWEKLIQQGYFTGTQPPPPDITAVIATLDGKFKPHFNGIKRHPHFWRPKTHGWEYRRLPATVTPQLITKVLLEVFGDPSTATQKDS
jgi:hypothetical protein